jgi:hypothetical protein
VIGHRMGESKEKIENEGLEKTEGRRNPRNSALHHSFHSTSLLSSPSFPSLKWALSRYLRERESEVVFELQSAPQSFGNKMVRLWSAGDHNQLTTTVSC